MMKLNDYITYSNSLKCPFCEEETMNTVCFKGTYIYICDECTFMGFEYRNAKDIENLQECILLRNTEANSVLNYHLYREEENEECPDDITSVEEFLNFLWSERPYQNVANVFELNYWLMFYGFSPIEKKDMIEED